MRDQIKAVIDMRDIDSEAVSRYADVDAAVMRVSGSYVSFVNDSISKDMHILAAFVIASSSGKIA